MPGVAENSGMKPCTLMAPGGRALPVRALHSGAQRAQTTQRRPASYLGWTSPYSCSAAPREAGSGTRCAAGRRRGMPRKEDDACLI